MTEMSNSGYPNVIRTPHATHKSVEEQQIDLLHRRIQELEAGNKTLREQVETFRNRLEDVVRNREELAQALLVYRQAMGAEVGVFVGGSGKPTAPNPPGSGKPDAPETPQSWESGCPVQHPNGALCDRPRLHLGLHRAGELEWELDAHNEGLSPEAAERQFIEAVIAPMSAPDAEETSVPPQEVCFIPGCGCDGYAHP